MGKRIFDIVFASVGLVVTFPIFVIAAIIIKLDSRGPIFFRQIRIGKNGIPFAIFKFRTMTSDSLGSLITVSGDERITKIGQILRKFKVDEIPQLINVLKGEMSFVGPRPEVEKYVNMYSREQRQVLQYRPGITDPASLKYRNENELLAMQTNPEKYYIDTIMPDKLAINLQYAKSATFVTDLYLICKTICASAR